MLASSLSKTLRKEYTADAFQQRSTRDGILTHAEFMTMVRSKAWKLVHFLDEPYGQLFNLLEDPAEVRNRWNDPSAAEMKQKMLAALREWGIRSQYHTAAWAQDWR